MRKKGFTLIELMIVMAIVAILAAVIFPVFSRVRDEARQAACTSNLKKMGIAIANYAQDYSQRYPGQYYDDGGFNSNGWQNGIPSWYKGVVAYTQTRNTIEICPSVKANRFNPNDYNMQYLFPRFCNYRAISAIRDPSSVVMLWERGENAAFYGTYPNPYNRNLTRYPIQWDLGNLPFAWTTMHNVGANYLWADGHVSWMKPEQQTDSMFWQL
jgi:prepilin-type N-terminal cleavage/methylation domain-containing protein/prepilin-type processing-associated H-X9-DG protein